MAAAGVYLDDGRIEIDNNNVENAIRPTALGKRNWLFIGEAEAGERSAILYSIVECCRRRGLDPYAYLRHVLTRLPLRHQLADRRTDSRGLGQPNSVAQTSRIDRNDQWVMWVTLN